MKNRKELTGYKNLKIIIDHLCPEEAEKLMMLVDHIIANASGNALHLSEHLIKVIVLKS